MTNYIIEDDIDFYQELNMSSNKDLNDVCLISNEQLNKNSIKLPCNHTFNYLPLYTEICKQKTKFNSLEITKLKTNQIKCPYCRLIINNLLPFNPDVEGVSKTRYVNSPSKYSFYPNKCKYIFKSGKSKGKLCNKNSLHDYCCSHNKTKPPVEEHNTELCTAVLKSGNNKGKQCGCKIHESSLCKRHWNINNK